MGFTWDKHKNQSNIRRHGIDFADTVEMFNYPMLTGLDRRMDYGEDRWVGIGILKGVVAVVVYTEDDKENIRIISARKAMKNEEKKFKESIGY